MSHVLSYAASMGDFRIMSRLAGWLETHGSSMTILTPKPSLMVRGALNRLDMRLVRYADHGGGQKAWKETVEVRAGTMDDHLASRFSEGVFTTACEVDARRPVTSVIVWNGSTVGTAAVVSFAREHHLTMLCLELSNIPGKLFVDPEGVNAASRLYREPELLDRYPVVPTGEYDHWREGYFRTKRTEWTTSTARSQGGIRNWLYPLDAAGVSLFGLPSVGTMNIMDRVMEKWRFGETAVTDPFHCEDGGYILYPMQVSGDSQLLFHSDISNDDALRTCAIRAADRGMRLVVRLHPTESHPDVADRVRRVTAPFPVIISSLPAMELVLHAEEVITINSTVGLESMIAGTPVTFLGRSYYPKLTGDRLQRYLLRYLLDIDYFSDSAITDAVGRELLERMAMR